MLSLQKIIDDNSTREETNSTLSWEDDDEDYDEPFFKKAKEKTPDGWLPVLEPKELMAAYTQLGKWTDRYNKLMALGGQVNIIMNKKTVTRKSQGDLLQSL